MLQRSKISVLLLAVGIVGGHAQAGFTLVTDADFALFNKQIPNQISIDDTFHTDGFHHFAHRGYIRDSADIPVIDDADFVNYRYSFEGSVTAVRGNVAIFVGTYSIVFDLLPWGVPDFDVSLGNFTFEATYITPTHALLSGQLHQTSGPEEVGFFDLTFGTSHPMTYVGEYRESSPGIGGELQGRIIQSIPTPGALSLLGLTGLTVLRRRR